MRQYNVPALDKAVAILDLLARSEEELTATEIHLAVGIPKATAFMILTVLERHRIVTKSESSRYTIGVRLFELGNSYVSKLDVVRAARPFLVQLLKRTNLTAHLGAVHGGRMIFLDRIEPQSFVRFTTSPGTRGDIHMSSLGKAIAAHLDPAELERIVAQVGLGAYTPNTITDPDAFAAELARVRERGYAVENEEGELGVRCVGAPIFDRHGAVVAAVSVTGLVVHIPEDRFATLGETVRETAEGISAAMGYSPPSQSRWRHESFELEPRSTGPTNRAAVSG